MAESNTPQKPKIKMKAGSFALQVSIFLALFVVFNLATIRLTRNSRPSRMLREIRNNNKPATDIVLGNSLVECGFNEQVFKEKRPKRVLENMGMSSTWQVEHYLLLNDYFKHHTAQPKTLKTVYYFIMDRMLTNPTQVEFSDLIGNRGMIYSTGLDDAAAGFYFGDDSWRRFLLTLSSKVPIVAYRHQFWIRVENLRRKAEDFGRKSESSNEFGRVGDFKILEESDMERFARLCREEGQRPIKFNGPIQEIIRLTRENNARLVVVRMPATSKHRREYYGLKDWKTYQAAVDEGLKRDGVEYIDASDWVPDKDFTDNVHLNPETGGPKFTARLLDTEKE